MVMTMYCLTIEFPTPTEIGYVKVNPTTIHQCHIQSLQMGRKAVGEPTEALSKPTIRGDVLVIEQRLGSDITLNSLDPKEEYLKPKLIDQTTDVQVD